MTDLGIEVFDARSEHLAVVDDLWRRIANEVEPNNKASPAREVQGLKRSLREFDFLESDSFWFLIAALGRKPVGYLTAARIPKADRRLGVLYVDELYVLTAYRCRGVGSALVGKVCTIGLELGYWRVRLKADQNDPRACSFYETIGFNQDGDGFFQRPIA